MYQCVFGDKYCFLQIVCFDEVVVVGVVVKVEENCNCNFQQVEWCYG